MYGSSGFDELSYVPESSWLWNGSICTDDDVFALAHGVVSWVHSEFVPYECHCLVLVSPCFHELYGDVEVRSGCPHVHDCFLASELFNIHEHHLLERHRGVVVRGRACFVCFFVEEGSAVIAPGRVGVDDIECVRSFCRAWFY